MDNTAPQLADPRSQDAWLTFIADTEPERNAYSEALDQAAKRRDAEIAQADSDSRMRRHMAWEHFNSQVTEAWREYMRATEPHRLRRESSAYPLNQLADTP